MLDDLHAAIVDRLTADMPALQTCAAYPVIRQKIAIDAVLLELDELEPADFGDSTADFYARFVAYCIVDPTKAGAEMAVRNLAAEVAVRVSQEADFGFSEVQRSAEVLRVSEDSFKPELDSYLVWAVEFQIGLALGDVVWSADPADGVSVTTITVGDLDSVSTAHVMADGNEPSAESVVELPDQPKG